ncbi:hypothetical protein ACOJBO_02485 [Rhizobium beringeri]
MAAACLLILAAPLLYIGFGPDREPARDIQTAQIKTVAPQPTASSITEELGEAMRLAGLKLGAKLANNGNESPYRRRLQAARHCQQTQVDGILAAISRRSPVPVVDMTTLSSGLAGFVAAAGYAPVKFVVGNDGRRYREGNGIRRLAYQGDTSWGNGGRPWQGNGHDQLRSRAGQEIAAGAHLAGDGGA